MTSSGILYDSSWNRTSGAVWLELPPSSVNSEQRTVNSEQLSVNRKSLFTVHRSLFTVRSAIKSAANLMLLIGAAGILLTMLPVAAIELKYQLEVNREQLTENSEQTVHDSLFTFNPTPKGPINQTQAFSVNIPKISANSVVIPNVDPADPKIYAPALKRGVAHALGTGLPGVTSDINRTIYLFAHSTSAPSLVGQYNAQFYLLNKLEVGDEINIVFWAKNYKYRVAEIKITDPDDVSFLKPQTEKEILVLATCTPPGTTWKRLLVLAEPTD